MATRSCRGFGGTALSSRSEIVANHRPAGSTLDITLAGLIADANGILSGGLPATSDQAVEIETRRRVAAKTCGNHLQAIARSHSIPVMDAEVDRFLARIPHGGVIIDVGGCWGWHWRHLATVRPDAAVVIVDLVRENLLHARTVLGGLIDRQVFLVHGDATDLRFPDEAFDGYWSVQTLQHVPRFTDALREAARVLKPGGVFADYSLNNQWAIRLAYRLLGREYHVDASVRGQFYLARASRSRAEAVEAAVGAAVTTRFTEVLFKPELGLRCAGPEGSWVGRVDRRLSSNWPLWAWVARQQSYHTIKPAA